MQKIKVMQIDISAIREGIIRNEGRFGRRPAFIIMSEETQKLLTTSWDFAWNNGGSHQLCGVEVAFSASVPIGEIRMVN